MSELVYSRVEADVIIATLARPEKLNALTLETLVALEEVFAAARSPAIRVMVLRGEGRSFCAGADVAAELGAATLTRASAFLTQLGRTLREICLLPKPVIVAVQGHAAGAGAELALAADFRIIAADAQLWFPDVAMGSSPASLYHLVRCVGRSKATRMAMLQERLSADEMLDCGIAYRVVGAGELERGALELAHRLSVHASEPLRLAKEAIRFAYEASYEAELDANISAMLVCYAGEDQRRAVRQFLGHRER